MPYKINITPEAQEDIMSLEKVIEEVYKSPLTAKRYIKGLIDEIKGLKLMPVQ